MHLGSSERPSLGFRIIREGAEQVHKSAEVNQMSPPDSPGNETQLAPGRSGFHSETAVVDPAFLTAPISFRDDRMAAGRTECPYL